MKFYLQFLLPVFLLLPLLALAQDDPFADAWDQASANMEPDSNEIDFIAAPPQDVPVDDTVLQQNYLDAIQAYYEYRVHGFNHRKAVFKWQLFSSKIVFFAVLFLLLAGMVFSWMQFQQGLKRIENDPDSKKDTGSSFSTQLEASTSGFKVSSPVLGVIILLISLLFFYLYLVYIYPIQEIF